MSYMSMKHLKEVESVLRKNRKELRTKFGGYTVKNYLPRLKKDIVTIEKEIG